MEPTNKKDREITEKQTVEQKPKSKITLFWEKYPHGYKGGCEVISARGITR